MQVRLPTRLRSVLSTRSPACLHSGKCNVDKCFPESGSGAVRRLITVRQERALDARGGQKIGGRIGRRGPAEGALASDCEERSRTERQAVSRSVRNG